MKKRYFMGIDVAKASFDFCLFSNKGSRLWKGHFSSRPRAGVDLSSPGSLSLSSANSMTWPFAALSCASFSTSLSAFLVTNNPLTPRLFLFLKPFGPQDRIYKLHTSRNLGVEKTDTLVDVGVYRVVWLGEVT